MSVDLKVALLEGVVCADDPGDGRESSLVLPGIDGSLVVFFWLRGHTKVSSTVTARLMVT